MARDHANTKKDLMHIHMRNMAQRRTFSYTVYEICGTKKDLMHIYEIYGTKKDLMHIYEKYGTKKDLMHM